MSKTSLTKKKAPKATDIGAQAHEQIMDYLRLAESSSNPAFVSATMTLAQERQKQHYKGESKLSPTASLVFCTAISLCTATFCCFFLVHYNYPLNLELVSVTVPLALLMIGLSAMFSGHLSQANFMVVFKWVTEQFKRLLPFGKSHSGELPISANVDESANDGTGD